MRFRTMATRKPRAMRGALSALAALWLLAGCAGSQEAPYVERSVEQLYNEAMDALKTKKYKTAAERFEEVDRQHPYSVWATRAQFMAAYANYMRNEYDDAIIALDRFIQLHPGSEHIDYAYYLKGLSLYEQVTDVGRDQKMTELALDAFQEVINRFPDTTYARDARLKIDLLNDHLAGKEMEVGRFYLSQGNLLAAITRFRRVVDRYQTTTHAPEALHRLTEGYLALGLTEEARKTAAVLGYNYPGSEWYSDSYALLVEGGSRADRTNQGWYRRLWDSVF
ncbi:MAG: outer membrane protein assembly factor BamD [Proteobacteria bacterium]|nr:outer membrane protein assembly factor BamD [Pseudomonadota bacterium]